MRSIYGEAHLLFQMQIKSPTYVELSTAYGNITTIFGIFIPSIKQPESVISKGL